MNNIRRFIDIVEAPEGDVIDRPPVRTPDQQQKEVPVHLPGGFTVVILNDPITPMEVVVEAIIYATRLSPDEAIRRMMRAHQGGWAAIASYASRDVAETVADRMMNHARNNNKYDHYKRHTGHQGPWPFTAEVIEADGGNGE